MCARKNIRHIGNQGRRQEPADRRQNCRPSADELRDLGATEKIAYCPKQRLRLVCRWSFEQNRKISYKFVDVADAGWIEQLLDSRE